MSVTNIAGRIKGYVVICAEGHFTERFLNICMHRGILLRDVKRRGETQLYASISIDAFREIRPIARKTKTHISIVSRCGLPFFMHRYKKRRTAIAGILIFILVLWYCSSHIMGIEIQGNERLSSAQISAALNSFDVKTGAAVRKIDRYKLQNQMMTALDDIAWIGINVKGSKVYVEIKERLDTKVTVDADTPCNLVAAKDGQIVLLEVTEGQTVVKQGDMVEKGNLLVSGALDSKAQGIRYAHSNGKVFAQTIYKKSKEYSLEYTEKIYTGNKKKRYSIGIADKRLDLFIKDRIPYENSDKTEKTSEYVPPADILPSISFFTEEFSEYTPKKKKMTDSEAAKKGETELYESLISEIPRNAEIISKNSSYLSLDGEKIVVTAEILCKEDIALQSPIDKIDFLNYDIGSEKNTQAN